jgi:hypothetical protein
MKVVDQVFDFIRLKDFAEGRHRSATIVNLMLNLLFVSPLADGAQIWSEISSATIHAMAVFAPFFVKDHRTGLLAIGRVGVNYRSGWLHQTTRESWNEKRKTGCSKDSGYDSSFSQEVNFSPMPDCG